MTRAAQSPVNALALTLPCDYCGAEADRWCVRRSRSTGEVTGRASWLHEARTWRLREAWSAGNYQGQVWATSEALFALDQTDPYSAISRGELGFPPTLDGLRRHLGERLEVHREWSGRNRQRLGDATGYDITE